VADGMRVFGISTLLEPEGRVQGARQKLNSNARTAHYGCKVDGMGFILSTNEVKAHLREYPAESKVVRAFLNGEDISSRPDVSPSRWIIDFDDMTLEEAGRYPGALARIERLVKPERAKNNRAARRDRWWIYGENAPGLRSAIKGLGQVLAMARISKVVLPMRVPTDQVFADMVCIFATDSYSVQAVLSSSAHWSWAVKYSSTLESRVNYAPSNAFDTFPMPEPGSSLVRVGQALDEERREIMLRRDLGLTKLYNLVNDPQIPDASDPDIARMRAIHVELDQAVMDAYGWSDIPLDHGFHTYRQMQRWTVSPAARVEILDRLLEENHRRAAEEGKQTAKPNVKTRRSNTVSNDQETLL